jgi:hypothetical protein
MAEKKAAKTFDLSLPTEPVKAQLLEPKSLVIMGAPKIGKTTACALLPKALVLNCEDKEQTTTGMIKYFDSYEMLVAILKHIRENPDKYNYMFGVVDTVTKLEALAEKRGEMIYARTLQGKNWIVIDKATGKLSPLCGKAKYRSILSLPKGAGYPYVTTALREIKQMLEDTFPYVIYLAHTKETQMEDSAGEEITVTEINLTGKNKLMFASEAQAIGRMQRMGKELYIQFQPSDSVIAGNKIDRLDGTNILVSKKKEDGTFETHWEEIYNIALRKQQVSKTK